MAAVKNENGFNRLLLRH